MSLYYKKLKKKDTQDFKTLFMLTYTYICTYVRPYNKEIEATLLKTYISVITFYIYTERKYIYRKTNE